MAFYRERDLKTFVNEVTSDGIGTAGGFIVGGFVGRQVENMLVKVPVDVTSPVSAKLLAWLANNGAKFGLYLAARHYGDGNITKPAIGALAGSVVYDTVLRLANKGVNPANVDLMGYRIMNAPENSQKIVQENQVLRTELNKALQKLAGMPVVTDMVSNPDSANDFKYAGIPDNMARQKHFGSMPVSPNVAERQRKYGAMPFEQPGEKTNRERRFGFASQNSKINAASSTFGML